MLEQTNGANFYGVNRNTQRRSFNLEIMFSLIENGHFVIGPCD
jgi:hypothetical protein